MAPLQDELRGLKASALRQRAAAEGIDQARIAKARDAESAKAAYIALILEHHTELDMAALRAMKKSALIARARADGVDGDAIDNALVRCPNRGADPARLLTMHRAEHRTTTTTTRSTRR